MSFLQFAIAGLMVITVAGLGGWRLLVCEHAHEIFDRYPDGRPALRCTRCLELRPNIMMGEPQFRRTQEGGPVRQTLVKGVATGIERVWKELDEPITDADLFPMEAGR
jgi:hypothetical protein